MKEHNNSITSILQKSALHLLNQTVGRLKHIYKKLTKYLIINYLKVFKIYIFNQKTKKRLLFYLLEMTKKIAFQSII
jgi:hypothetical protein